MKNSVRSLIAIGALAGAAAFVSANANAGRELIISAPIQQLDHGADTVTVLGQTFHTETNQLNVGEVVKVYGVLQKDGSIADAVVEGTNAYATNGDPVFLKGVVTGTDPALGQVEVDGMTVDYTSQLANADFAAPGVGDVIAITASQPATQGVLIASATGAAAYVAPSASSAVTPSELPTDALKLAQITGGGTAQITGGGTAQITGGGTAQITGGGTAQITGGGTAQITGGGTAQITGGGTAQITGGGTAQISGGGIHVR
jgi:hypothetical protein